MKFLYHYTSADSAKEILRTLSLKWSVYPRINDHLDMNKDILYDPEDKDGEKIYNLACNDAELRLKPIFARLPSMSKEKFLSILQIRLNNFELRSIVKKTPFICFSKEYDIHLMWAHYGNGGRGVVLEFSQDIANGKFEQVIYKDFEVLPSVLSAERLIALLKNDEKEIYNFGITLLITKHIIWSYEQEYRFFGCPIVDSKQHIPQFYKFNPKSLTGIYFGVNIINKDTRDIIKLLKNNNICQVKKIKMERIAGYMKIFPKEFSWQK